MRAHSAVLTLVFQLFVHATALAQQADVAPQEYTLSDALRLMREQHPALKSARAAIDAASADRSLARLWTNPVLGGSYTKGVRRSSYDDAGYITYGVTQFVELSGAPGARTKAAGLLVEASRADRNALVLALSLAVESALIDVVTIDRKLALVEQAMGLIDHAVTIVSQRVQAGAAPRYDATRIAVTAANAHADLEELRAQLAVAGGELRAAIGPGGSALRGKASFALDQEAPLPSAEQLLSLLASTRPDLEAARQRAASAQANIDASRRSIWPGLAVNVVGGFGAAPGQQDVGVGLSVPLPIVNRGQGLVWGAEARAEQAARYVDAVLVPARARVEGLREQVLARRRALADYAQRAVASGDEMLQEAQSGYLAGRFSVLELADAYSAWRSARLRALELAATARQAEVALSREVGVVLRDLR